MRPDDISAAAWGYAGRYHHDRMYGYDASSRERTDIHNRRRQMAKEFDAATKPLREANVMFVRWMVEEDKGPQYPFGMTRKSEGGEEFWRKWWDENERRCSRAVDSAKASHEHFTPKDTA